MELTLTPIIIYKNANVYGERKNLLVTECFLNLDIPRHLLISVINTSPSIFNICSFLANVYIQFLSRFLCTGIQINRQRSKNATSSLQELY